MKYNKTEAVTKVTTTLPIMKVNFSPESFVIINAPKMNRNNPSALFIHFFLYGLTVRNKAPKRTWNRPIKDQ
jgi:hypothetical protein